MSHEKLGDIEQAAGNLDQARARYSQRLDIMSKLAGADPGNAQWQRDLSVSHERLGDIEQAAGNLDQARAHYMQDLEIASKLAGADPGNAQWQRDLIASEMKLAIIHKEFDNLPEARRHLTAAKTVLARMDAAGMLRGDALLEEWRQYIANFERRLPP